MSDKEELERLKAHVMRKDETERQTIFNALARIERKVDAGCASVDRVEDEQRRTTKILFGDESDSKPGLVKRVDRLEGKMKLLWGSITASLGALFHGIIK